MSGPRIAHSWGYGPQCMAYTGIPFQHNVGMKYNAYSGIPSGQWNLQVVPLPYWDGEGAKPNVFTFQCVYHPLSGNMLEMTRAIPISFVDNDGDEIVIYFTRSYHQIPDANYAIPEFGQYHSFPGIISVAPNCGPVPASYTPVVPVFGGGRVPPTHVGAASWVGGGVNGGMGLWIGRPEEVAEDSRTVIIHANVHPVEGSFLPAGYLAIANPSLIGSPTRGIVLQAKFNLQANLSQAYDDPQDILDIRDENTVNVSSQWGPAPQTVYFGYTDNQPVVEYVEGRSFDANGNETVVVVFGPAVSDPTAQSYPGYPVLDPRDALPITAIPEPTTTPYYPSQPVPVQVVPGTGPLVNNPAPITFTSAQDLWDEFLDGGTHQANQQNAIIDLNPQSPQPFESSDLMPTAPEYTGPDAPGSLFGGDRGIWGDFNLSEYLDGSWNPGQDPASEVFDAPTVEGNPDQYDPSGSAGGFDAQASGYEDTGDWGSQSDGDPWW